MGPSSIVNVPFNKLSEPASYPDVSLDENLRFSTSHSRFALASMRNHAKNEGLEEEAVLEQFTVLDLRNASLILVEPTKCVKVGVSCVKI